MELETKEVTQMNTVNGTLTISFSIPTDAITPQAAMEALYAQLGDGLGICKSDVRLCCTDGNQMKVDVDNCEVEINGVNEDWA